MHRTASDAGSDPKSTLVLADLEKVFAANAAKALISYSSFEAYFRGRERFSNGLERIQSLSQTLEHLVHLLVGCLHEEYVERTSIMNDAVASHVQWRSDERRQRTILDLRASVTHDSARYRAHDAARRAAQIEDHERALDVWAVRDQRQKGKLVAEESIDHRVGEEMTLVGMEEGLHTTRDQLDLIMEVHAKQMQLASSELRDELAGVQRALQACNRRCDVPLRNIERALTEVGQFLFASVASSHGHDAVQNALHALPPEKQEFRWLIDDDGNDRRRVGGGLTRNAQGTTVTAPVALGREQDVVRSILKDPLTFSAKGTNRGLNEQAEVRLRVQALFDSIPKHIAAGE